MTRYASPKGVRMTFTDSDFAAAAQRIEKGVPFDLAWASAVAILVQRGSTAQVHGSGTVFRIADESFIITAAHVIESKGSNNLMILLAGDDRPLPCHGEAIVSASVTTDVAALQLPPEIAEQIPPSRFLRFDNVSLAQNAKNAMFAVFGFPQIMCSHNKGILKVTRFHHVAPVFEGPASDLGGYNSSTHLLIDADIDETRTTDGKLMDFCYQGGIRAPFPGDLHGISGGSVWRVFDHPADVPAGRANPKLVAVENAVYHDRRCIKATWWKAVVEMLWAMRPDLRDALLMYRG